MQMIWSYQKGDWQEVFSNPSGLLPWNENEETHCYLDRNGYSVLEFTLGSEISSIYCDIYIHNSCKKWYGIAHFSDVSAFDFIIPDFPSMLMFIKEYKECFQEY